MTGTSDGARDGRIDRFAYLEDGGCAVRALSRAGRRTALPLGCILWNTSAKRAAPARRRAPSQGWYRKCRRGRRSHEPMRRMLTFQEGPAEAGPGQDFID